MASDGPRKKTGRPRVEERVDEARLRRMVRARCTQHEIARGLGMSPRSAERMLQREPYRSIMDEEVYKRALDLREAQLACALKDRNIAMLIWLGKNELGQSEPTTRHEVSAEAHVGLSDPAALSDRLARLARSKRANGHDREAAGAGTPST